ncbi:MAG TPA: type II secretion system F family protein [Acetobacteraceae bacterium]|nr:type II secretion system F family protein [Acetobacteraceae bacterium]
MTTSLPPVLLMLGIASLLLSGLGISGVLLLRSIELRRRAEARIAGVVRPLARPRSLRTTRLIRSSAPQPHDPVAWAAWLFGFDPARADQYPAAWWMVLALCGAAAIAGGRLISALLGPVGLAAAPLLWLGLSRAVFGWSAARNRRQLLLQFPDTLAMIVRAIRVGIPIAEAIRSVAHETEPPTATEFARLHDQILIGVPLDEGLRAMAQRTGLGEYRFFATAITLQSQTGGGLTEVMENLADLIRRRVALQSRGRALSSEARSSAIVLSLLPFATGMMLWLIEPSYIALLFNEHLGRIMLGGATASLITGVFSMRTIIRRTLA